MIPESYLMHYGTKGMKWGHSNSQYYIAVGTPADPATRTVNPYTGNSTSTSTLTINSTSRDNDDSSTEQKNNFRLSILQNEINNESANNTKYIIEKNTNFGTTLRTGFEDAMKLISSDNYTNINDKKSNRLKKERRF